MKKVKYLILGAGPGGLQMGSLMQEKGLDYLILEKNDVAGSFFKKNPVHRKLISLNKKFNFFKEEEFNWRHDWNSLLSSDPKLRFTNYTDELFPSADVLCEYFVDFAKNLTINYGVEVVQISRDKKTNLFVVDSSNGDKYIAEVVFSALGALSPIKPSIEGIEHTINYEDQSVDLNKYKNKRVAVLGGGNSAFETADYLAPVAAYVNVLIKHPIKMAWDTHFVGDLRAVNNNILDMYQLKSLHGVLNPKINKIVKNEDGTLVTYHEYDFPNSKKPGTLKLTREYDYIINCTGWKWVELSLFHNDITPEVKPSGKYLQLDSMWESVNVKDLYFIGAVMQSIDRKSASGFIHGFRYNIRSLFNLIVEKYERIDYPSESFTADNNWNGLLNKLYERFSISAGLFQLYGFLSDVIIFDEENGSAKLYKEIPLEHVNKRVADDQKAIVVSLEFGFHKHQETSSLAFLGPSDPHDTDCASFLHPVIRYYHNGFVDEFHFGDSLLARWDRPHEGGGAIASYHNEFLLWLNEKIGLNIDIADQTIEKQGNYRFWSDEEIAKWQKMKMEKESMVEDRQCYI